MIAYGLAFLVISLGAILAGRGYVRTARRMRSYQTTRGRVFKRELATVAGDTREGVWGKGGGYRPDGDLRVHRRRRRAHVRQGHLRPSRPAQVAGRAGAGRDPGRGRRASTTPQNPDEAYLVKHSPRLGYWLIGGGVLGALFGLLLVLASF